MVARIPKAVIKKIEALVDQMFDHAKARFLGPQSVPRRLFVSYRRDLSLPGLYEAAHIESRGIPDREVLDTLIRTAGNYLDANRLRAKARVVKEVQSFVRDAENAGEDVDVATVLGGKMSDLWGSVTADVRRIFDTEAQQTRGVGVIDGISRANAAQGIEDPIIFFVVVRDNSLCPECKRLHLLEDEKTPRVYYMSEVQHSYHKKGEDSPCVGGLHPHCRCSMTTLMPGFGFDKAGLVTWKKDGYSEIDHQRGVQKNETGQSMSKELAKGDMIKFPGNPSPKQDLGADAKVITSQIPNQKQDDIKAEYHGVFDSAFQVMDKLNATRKFQPGVRVRHIDQTHEPRLGVVSWTGYRDNGKPFLDNGPPGHYYIVDWHGAPGSGQHANSYLHESQLTPHLVPALPFK